MEIEITDIREQSIGYRIDFNQVNGTTCAIAANVLITFRELINFVQENGLNIFKSFNEDIEETVLYPQTFIEENHVEVLNQYLMSCK